MMTQAEKLKWLLNRQGWSQSKLARVAGLPQRTVSYIVSRGREPGVVAAMRIADALGVQPSWLWNSDTDPPPPESVQGGPAIQLLPDAVVMEDILRRKRMAREAFETLIEKYVKFRNYFRNALKESVGKDGKVAGDSEARKVWAEFSDAFHAYFHTFNAWHDYEERWYQIHFHGRIDEPIADEMFKVFGVMRSGGSTTRVISAIQQVLKIWSESSVSQHRIEALAQDIFDLQDRMIYLLDENQDIDEADQALEARVGRLTGSTVDPGGQRRPLRRRAGDKAKPRKPNK